LREQFDFELYLTNCDDIGMKNKLKVLEDDEVKDYFEENKEYFKNYEMID